MKAQNKLNYLCAISAVIAGSAAVANAQVQVAGNLLVNVDATSAPLGALPSITNSGTLGGYFEARYGTNIPTVAVINGNGSQGIRFDGIQFLQHVSSLGGSLVSADPSVTGVNPTLSIEVWAFNPGISAEETMVSWAHRGTDHRNISFNYGFDDRWGAMGHWGSSDMGWDPCCDSGTNPQGVPKSGEWHLLTYTYDGTVQRAYADGVLKNSEVVSLDLFPAPAFNIGAQYSDDSNVEPGLRATMTIAKVRIHSEALTASQVANNYTFEAGGFAVGGSPLPFQPTHRYSFNNSAGAATNGAVITDSIGGAHGVVRGAGGNFTGTRLTIPGGSSLTAAYVDLPNGLLSTNGVANGGTGEITVEGWVKNTGTRNWGRVYDFGNGAAGELNDVGPGGVEGRDYWFLSGTEGTNPQRHNVSIRNLIPPTGSDTGIGWDTANANRDYHFAVAWKEATGEWLIYENGTLVASRFVNPVNDTFSSIQDVNVWLGRSNWTGDDNFQGEYDEFRIYNRVLTAQQVRASYSAGPNALATADPVSFTVHPQNQTVNEFGSTTLSVAAQGAPPIALQWYTNDVPAAGANGATFSLNNIPAAYHGMEIFVIASNNIGGTAFYATSSVATLTVNADTNPPVITTLRANTSTNIEIVFSEVINPADVVMGNFSITGPSGPLTITAAAAGADSRRTYLTVSTPLEQGQFTVTATGIHDVAAAANTAPTSGTLWNLTRPNLTHRYTFNNPPSADATGATVPDSVGTADGVVLNGAGVATFTGDRVTLSGGSAAGAPYIDLPNGMLSSHSTNNSGSGQVTFEGWVRVTGNRSWSRILDFGSTTNVAYTCCGAGHELTAPGGGREGVDYLFYSAQNGGDTGTRRVDVTDRDGSLAGGQDFGVTNFNSEFHFAITWDEATAQVRVYENGVQVASFASPVPMSNINDVNVWLGRSNWTVDQNMQGEFNEFRVYDRVLTPSEVGFHRGIGPDVSLGTPLALDLVTTNSPYYTNTTQLIPVLVSFSNAGTQNVAGVGLVTYSSSDSNVVEITSDGVLHAKAAGFANVTATFFGLTETASVEVTADSTPPTIVRVRANSETEIEVTYSEKVDNLTATDVLFYNVESAGHGPLTIDSIIQYTNEAKVLLRFLDPLPSDYITVSASDVEDQIGNFGDNGSGSFVYHLPTHLKHRYNFNTDTNSLASGLTIPNVAGPGDATLLGAPVILSGDRVLLGGGASGSAGYVDLPNGVLSTNSTNNGGSGQFTLEVWFRHTGNRTWGRVFDIGSSGVCCGPGGEIPGSGGPDGIDYLMLSQVGGDSATRRFEYNNRDQNRGGFVRDYAVTNFGSDVHMVCTWDERTGQLQLFENGELRASATTVSPMTDVNDVNVWLGRSNWTGDQNFQGEFDEARVYNRVLSTNDIAVNRLAGPDYDFGAPTGLRFNAPTLLYAGVSITPTSRIDFVNVTNVDVSGVGIVTLTSSNPSVVSNDASGVLYPLSVGTATITQSYAGFQNTLTFTVTNVPPIAGNDTLVTSTNTPGVITLAKLLSNDSDPDGGLPLSVSGVSATSTNGGTVVLGASDVTYTPPAGYVGPDLFTYTLSDSFGALSSGNVYVYVLDGPVPSQGQILLRFVSGGQVQLTFRGTPGTSYRIQRATEVVGPWTTIDTQTASPSGIIIVTDPAPPPGQAFYKVVPPSP